MFSFLNFSFDFDSPRAESTHHVVKNEQVAKKVSNNSDSILDGKGWSEGFVDKWRVTTTSDSAATSPMSNRALTPKTMPMINTPPPKKSPLESPEARPAEICETEGIKKRLSVRRRRSSVFFKLPELERVRTSGDSGSGHGRSSRRRSRDKGRDKNDNFAPAGEGSKQQGPQTTGGSASVRKSLSKKIGKSSGRRRSRRASIAPGGSSPVRTREDHSFRTAALKLAASPVSYVLKDPSIIGPAAAAAAVAAGESPQDFFGRSDDDGNNWINEPRGELLPVTREEENEGSAEEETIAKPPAKRIDALAPLQPRPSPRALSAGHRRESCRVAGIACAPKGLSAERLLEDAQDMARIRLEARLRANHQGVCWIASNWCVAGTQGVLSGKRFLVLCDNIVWAELREADKRLSVGGEREQAGFLPVISMDGASVQHCKVPTSNNGWVIEVINPITNVTLWLDPDNPTSLLRWGSVLCQALVRTADSDEATGK